MEFVLGSLSCFNIEIAYLNFTFCGTQFLWVQVKIVTNSGKRAHLRWSEIWGVLIFLKFGHFSCACADILMRGNPVTDWTHYTQRVPTYNFSKFSQKLHETERIWTPLRSATELGMCRHTNKGIPFTEHVQMLHCACADILMKGYPVTYMTGNTEDRHANWQCLHTQL